MKKRIPVLIGFAVGLAVLLGCSLFNALDPTSVPATQVLPDLIQTQMATYYADTLSSPLPTIPSDITITPTVTSSITASITPSITPSITTSPSPSLTPTATDTATATSTPTKKPTPTKPQAGGKDPILFINSDLVSVNSMDRAQKVIDLIQHLMSQHPGTQMLVASAGDNEQENVPTLSDYQNYFDKTYGIFVNQGIFRPVRGNHDVQDAGHGQAYSEYFDAVTHFEDIPIENGQMNYSYSYGLGTWHIIGLDQLSQKINKSTLDFLQADLADHSDTLCQLVYWHVPTYSSGLKHGDATDLIPLNQAEYDSGVDIQINGHDHDYQRFFPINPDGQRDDAKGITTFIAGIGGQDINSGSQTSIAQDASALYLGNFPGGKDNHAIGVLQFTLHATSADYALYDANNGAVLDRGKVKCH